jgi:hypothetical protein
VLAIHGLAGEEAAQRDMDPLHERHRLERRFPARNVGAIGVLQRIGVLLVLRDLAFQRLDLLLQLLHLALHTINLVEIRICLRLRLNLCVHRRRQKS